MNNAQTRKILNEIRFEFMRQTGHELLNFNDPKFGSWLQEIASVSICESNSQYLIVDQKDFSRSILEAYLEAINQVSKSLDKRGTEETYTKLEILNIISEAFDIAKTEGEKRIRQIKKS